MVPVIVAGGVLLAFSFIGGTPTKSGYVITNPFMQTLNLSGNAGFAMMVPVLGAYVAYSIAGRPGLTPGFILGYIANNPIGNTQVKAGFLGALLMGILAGYFVRWMKSWKIPTMLKPIMPVLIIPVISALVLGLFYVYVINTPIVIFSEWILSVLNSLENANIILFAFVLGLICEIDRGGPICKAVTLFCIAMIDAGNYEVNAMFFVCTSVPPLAVLLSTVIFKNKWTDADRIQARSAGVMGVVGITEGTIPFIVEDALHILPRTMIGCGCAVVTAALSGVSSPVPHGGIFPVLVTGNPIMYIGAQVVGIVVGAIIVGILRRPVAADAK